MFYDLVSHPTRAHPHAHPQRKQVGSADDLDPSEWQVPPHCIPIHANVTTFDWSKLSSVTSFDVVMMDPPWQLATANPTRGVALGYSQLTGIMCSLCLLLMLLLPACVLACLQAADDEG